MRQEGKKAAGGGKGSVKDQAGWKQPNSGWFLEGRPESPREEPLINTMSSWTRGIHHFL